MGINYINKGWYYWMNLGFYLVVVIWAIGIIAPFAVVGVAIDEISWGIKGWRSPPGGFIMMCYGWTMSAAYGAIRLSATMYMVLVLIGVILADIPLTSPRRVIRYLLRGIPPSSLKLALWEQGLWGIYKRLLGIVPDINHQYTTVPVETDYMRLKIRATHAFQVKLMGKALCLVRGRNPIGVVDIGDSSGTHTKYIQAISDKGLRCSSVNMDVEAVEKIRELGLDAILGRAEEVEYPLLTHIFMIFAMLEHMPNPSEFLYMLSKEPNCKALIISVPYLKRSRVGLRHIRMGRKVEVCAENTHIYEISPDDWRLIFRHSGWAVHYDQVFYQYPRHIPVVSELLQRFWQRNDFEGFYGAVLTPDNTWSRLYTDWSK